MQKLGARVVLLELASAQSRHLEEEDPVTRRMVHTVPVAYGLDHNRCARRSPRLPVAVVAALGLPSS